MLVIMDVEWVERGFPRLTQLAALRVDGAWVAVDAFSARIRPREYAQPDWTHVAFSGGTPEDFRGGSSLSAALEGLLRWLREEDALCWWSRPAPAVLRGAVEHALWRTLSQRECVLAEMVRVQAGERRRKDPYTLADQRGIPIPGQPHCSTSDVEVVRRLLANLRLPYGRVLARCCAPSAPKPASAGKDLSKYVLDPRTRLVHRADSPCLEAGVSYKEYGTARGVRKDGLKPCPACCAAALRRELEADSADLMRKNEWRFVYSAGSTVYHRVDCAFARRILRWHMRGAGGLVESIVRGRTPCKRCRPDVPRAPAPAVPAQATPARTLPPPAQSSAAKRWGANRTLSDAERKACMRREEALRERMTTDTTGMDDAQRRDFCTLTRPDYAFWAAQGYDSFHLRRCPRLAGRTGLKGFARFRDAVQSGLRPCKTCRPTARQDIRVVVAGEVRQRDAQTVERLDALCAGFGFAAHVAENQYFIETPVGRWRMDLTARPVLLWHINLVRRRGRAEEYHRQPCAPLSLEDAVRYIHRHDKRLLLQAGSAGKPMRPAGREADGG